MFKHKPIAAILLSAGFLQGCIAPPTRQELAVQPLMRVTDSAGQDAGTYYRLGKFYQERGKLDLALDAYQHSIALDARQAEARNAAAALYATLGRLDEAQAVLSKLLDDYPTMVRTYNNLGYVYFMQGNYDSAIDILQRALTLDTGYEKARNNLAMVQSAALQRQPRQAAGLNHLAATDQPLPAPAPVAAPVTPAPARLELVQVRPEVYALRVPAPPAQRASQAVATTPSPQRAARLEIANGNGVTGMARQVRQLLGQLGIGVGGKLSNQRPFTRQTTTIEYRAGYRQDAEALNIALLGKATMTPLAVANGKSDVRLVLGKDMVGHLASSLQPVGGLIVSNASFE